MFLQSENNIGSIGWFISVIIFLVLIIIWFYKNGQEKQEFMLKKLDKANKEKERHEKDAKYLREKLENENKK